MEIWFFFYFEFRNVSKDVIGIDTLHVLNTQPLLRYIVVLHVYILLYIYI